MVNAVVTSETSLETQEAQLLQNISRITQRLHKTTEKLTTRVATDLTQVNEAMTESVEKVGKHLTLDYYVENHKWEAFGAAAAVGLFAGIFANKLIS